MTADYGIPELPYAGTSGWSGSDTSRDRAEHNDGSGKTKKHQRETLALLAASCAEGLTWKELSEATGWHHGTASGALSVLHKTGLIKRLAQHRDGSAIYVMPAWVLFRETRAYAANKPKKCPHCGGAL